MPTYTNLCILQGWFEVESARTVVANRTSVLVVEGRIHTTDRDGIRGNFR